MFPSNETSHLFATYFTIVGSYTRYFHVSTIVFPVRDETDVSSRICSCSCDEPFIIPRFPFYYQSVLSLIQIEPFMLGFKVTSLFLVIIS